MKNCNKKVTKSLLKTGLCLELPTGGFISQWVMPENQIPATQPEPGGAPGEFDFAQPASENPRLKRRSLKAKPKGLLQPSGGTPSAARELEREAPPLSAEQVIKSQPQEPEIAEVEPAAKVAETPTAPPRTTPSTTTTSFRPASSSTTSPRIASTISPSTSPHGTRPATLYYSSSTRKAENPSPMKTIPTASPASSSSASSTTTLPSSAARSATASTRPATTIDYRANVERQSREQKSVGNILTYVVYTLIGFFVISAALAGYGTKVIFDRLHDQSATVSDLDQRYAKVTTDLSARLTATQDTLNQAQAQITRQQDLIVKQQEEINRIIAATNDNATAFKAEKQARSQETAALRARVKDLENRGAFQH